MLSKDCMNIRITGQNFRCKSLLEKINKYGKSCKKITMVIYYFSIILGKHVLSFL